MTAYPMACPGADVLVHINESMYAVEATGKLIESKLDAIVRASLRLDNFSALIENELYKAREQMSVLQYALYAVAALCLVLVLNYCAVAFYVSRIKPPGETFVFV